MTRPILVTGASGQVGGELVRLLLAEGHDVRALVRSEGSAKRVQAAHDGVETVLADLGDAPAVRRVALGAEVMFLMSPVSIDLAKLQIAALDAAREAGVRRVVKLSTMRADPRSALLFERAHGEVEMYLRDCALPATVLRPNAFMQNLLLQSNEIASDRVLRAPAGEGRVGFVDARDVAAVAAKAIATPGNGFYVYELSGPRAITHGEIAATLSEVLHWKVRYEPQSRESARRAWEATGRTGWQLDDAVALYEGFRTGRWDVITGEVTQVTGRPPRTFEDFIRDYQGAFKPLMPHGHDLTGTGWVG